MKLRANLSRYFSFAVLLSVFLAGCGGAPGGGTVNGGGSGTTGSLQLGSGGGDSFQDGEASAQIQVATASSVSWLVSVTVVDGDNIAITDAATIRFSSSCVTAGLAGFDSESVTTSAGRASVLYTSTGSSGSCTGVDTAVASLSIDGQVLRATVDLNIDSNLDTSGGGGGGGGGPIDDTSRIGNGSGGDFEEGVIAAGSTDLLAGGSTTLAVNFVDSEGALIADVVSVTFSSPCVDSQLAEFDRSLVNTSGGVATTTYTARGCVNSDTVTAVGVTQSGELEAGVTLNVQAGVVQSLNFVEMTDSIIALPGTGGTETTEVTFRLVSTLGTPVVGEEIVFELTTGIGGVTIVAGSETDISDSDGRVSTTIQSGTVSTSLSVIARHASTDNRTTSDSIIISSGVPVDSKFSVSLSSFTPQNAFNTDNIEVDVSVIASDFFGNDVPDGVQVIFSSTESGNIDSSCVIKSGQCTVKWRSAGARPDNLRATILAYTDGAEDFVDVNGNTVFDVNDTRGADLAEPYADDNENGIHDDGELFVDGNNNQMRDVGNNLWDGPCLSAVNSVADCSGNDTVVISKGHVIQMPTNSPRVSSLRVSYDRGATFSDFPLGGVIDVRDGVGSSVYVEMSVADSNTSVEEFGGHALPEATDITISGPSGYSLSGGTLAEVARFQRRPNVMVFVITDSNTMLTAGFGAVELNVAVPNFAIATLIPFTVTDE